MPHLSLSFLGGFEVSLDGEPITAFGTDKVRALLAYLAIESARPQRRSELAASFWPDLSDKKAAHNLSQTLLRLRRALREPDARSPLNQPPWLLVTGQTIQFNPHCDHRLDVAYFTALLKARRHHQHAVANTCPACVQWLQQAADLYRGDLLSGFFVQDSVAFEEWRIVKQEALHAQAIDALDQLATYYERSEQYDRALAYARRQVALEPWREDAHLQLMRALASNGQSAAALEQFESYRHTLAQELNVHPSAEATAFYEQIRSGAINVRNADRSNTLTGQPERRQVTVLSCRCGTSDRLDDPDGLYEQFMLCEQQCQPILERLGGQRTSRHGSECLIYFGYPAAYEDNARRAVLAGLAMTVAPQSHTTSSACIGIHTGIMVVHKRREPTGREPDLVGDAPDLARSCRNTAKPGDVMITETTERLVRGEFECKLLEPHVSTGQANSVEVYRVIRARGLPDRLDWLAHTHRLTPFVGRESELAKALACLEKARNSLGQVILVKGLAGIGKSRLARELKQAALTQANREPIGWLESRCSPYFQNTSLQPIIQLLEQLLGFEEDDTPELKRAKLARILDRVELTHPPTFRHLALLLGLSDEESAASSIAADERERMRVAFVTLLQKQAAEQPLVVLIEDLHWSDPSTLEWLDRSFDSLAAARCLLLVTTRSTFDPGWLPRAHVISLAIGPLNPAQTERMTVELAGEAILREEARQHIVARTDGIPLYVEELTKTVLESGGAEIPATLRDSLTARLDHLGAAKETAQWAAALGREFSPLVLSAVTAFDERRLQHDLARLVEAGLICPQGQGAHTSYTFSHVLVQEAAHASLLKRAYQDHHRRIAETLVARFPSITESQPEVIAQHYAQAGLSASAADYWLRTGERAIKQGATSEARAFFDRALTLIEPEDIEKRWSALWGREKVLDLQGDRVAQEADVAALLELAERLDDDTGRAQVYLRQSAYAAMIGNYRATLPPAEAACTAARRAGNLALELRALAYRAQTLNFLKELSAARQVLGEALAQVPRVEVPAVRALVLTVAAQYFMEAGDFTRSLQLQRQSVEAAQRAGDPNLAINTQANLGLLYATLGMYPQARVALEAARVQAEVWGDRRLYASTLSHLGYVYECSGESNRARETEELALAELMTTGDAYGEATCRAHLGLILEGTQNWELAAEHLARARIVFDEIGAEPHKFEVQAAEARCLAALGQPEEARQLASEVWAFVRAHNTALMDLPSRVFLCTADVTAQILVPEVTEREVIDAGYAELLRRAELITDPEWRRPFLEDERFNRTIAERWRQHTG